MAFLHKTECDPVATASLSGQRKDNSNSNTRKLLATATRSYISPLPPRGPLAMGTRTITKLFSIGR